MPDAPMPVDLFRFALNALLLPLLTTGCAKGPGVENDQSRKQGAA